MHHPTGLNQSIHASIEVHDLRLSYAPGDVVHGIVKKVTTESKSSSGHTSKSHYVGQRTLFNFRQQIYDGLAAPGSNSWSFSITVPSQPTAIALPNGTVLPMEEPLPPTFNRPRERILGGDRDYLYVEYRLEAEVYQASSTQYIATFPIYVRPRSTGKAIEDPVLRAVFVIESVKTLHLDPEYANKSLSFRQHMQTVFQRSKLPEYEFTIVVEYPSRIQLEHPDPMPFRIRALSNDFNHPSKTTGSLMEKPPVLALVSAELRLRSAVHTDALEGRSYKVTSKQGGHWHDNYLFDWKQDADGSHDISIPDDTRNPNEVVDIGKNINLFVSPYGVSVAGCRHAPFKAPIYPSFNTRYINHVHELRWKLVVRCAGKDCKITGTAAVTVVGPSEQEEEMKTLGMRAEGITGAHWDWANGVVDTPMLSMSVVLSEQPSSYWSHNANDHKAVLPRRHNGRHSCMSK
ncbi:hypothetical protein BJ170DRAFT_692455 [Xylariales sp. AK1849]|nr:hypothetical protein BJ170DRAFT_692455 [Xylariales sp. AK1849]